MDKPIENFWQIRLSEVKAALEDNNFEVFLAQTEADVHQIVLDDLIPRLKPRTVSWGGSMTFTGSGLYKKLVNQTDIEVWESVDWNIAILRSDNVSTTVAIIPGLPVIPTPITETFA